MPNNKVGKAIAFIALSLLVLYSGYQLLLEKAPLQEMESLDSLESLESIDSIDSEIHIIDSSMDAASGHAASESIESQQNLNPIESLEELMASPGGYNKKYGWGIVRSKNEKGPQVPQWEIDLLKDYDAFYIGKKDEKAVTLTFDMGYEKEGGTPKILDTLAKHNIKATFFFTGHWVKTQPDLLKRIIEEGHIVGNHTWKHPSLPDLSGDKIKNEIMVLHNHIKDHTGYETKYLRPPRGEFSRRSLEISKNLGYQSVFWSIAVVDWKPSSNEKSIYQGVIDQLHPGAIILLHGNSEGVINQLENIIDTIEKKGYKIVSLEDIKPYEMEIAPQ
ncbi:polysaccharide deacetylase family protein [Heliorestis convoluta]|uniref:Delta-lactam-biosynthetic de-N-acetylase n=1 Tax=Heliorestis convoluta TaxID=356322 RepID=A0A5Q2N2P2_9FIRM|nr:polysaccharide deacetylase family protein [Heliorestis convoluta]QGG48139.1 Delta-lactam-biosynthetic de-N-acetylase [Heliorestis convoluta]